MLWDRLESRAPSCAAHVTRMKEQHAEMLVHLQELDASLPAWRASGRATDAASVARALAGINAALAVHLPDEETHIVPVMETVLTPKEVEGFAEHGRNATPKGKTFIQLGAILAAQPDGGTEWQHKHLPAPVRLIWRLVGTRSTRRRGLLSPAADPQWIAVNRARRWAGFSTSSTIAIARSAAEMIDSPAALRSSTSPPSW